MGPLGTCHERVKCMLTSQKELRRERREHTAEVGGISSCLHPT